MNCNKCGIVITQETGYSYRWGRATCIACTEVLDKCQHVWEVKEKTDVIIIKGNTPLLPDGSQHDSILIVWTCHVCGWTHCQGVNNPSYHLNPLYS